MDWPYHFVNPDAEGLAQRRKFLDSYANYAQLSAIVLLIAVKLNLALHQYLTKLRQSIREADRRSLDHDKKPPAKGFSDGLLRSFLDQESKWSWQLDDELVSGWGTKRQVLLVISYAAWLLFLVLKDTADDYLHVTKRFAIVAASQLPFHYLLSAKSPWNPIQLLIKRSHEQLNPYHRLLGRVLITLFTVHATLYLNFYIQANLLGKRIRDRDVQLGLAAIISFLTIGSTALSTVREYSYRVFYVAHIILSTAILPILYYHVAYVRVYVIQTAAVHILLTIIDRYLIDQRHIVPADIYPVPNTSLISIVLRPGKHFSRNRILKPGHHIYISRAFVQEPSPIALNPMNPFSVANLPMDIAPQIHLVVRALSGTTGKLAAAAHFNPDGPYYVKMERPYASSNYFPDLLSYDRVLLVSGGVGATFTLAFYCALLGQISDLQQRDSSAAAAQAEKLRFVWTVRDIAEAWFGINTIRRQCGRLPSSFSLNITGNVDREKVPQVLFSDPSWSSDWEVMNARTNSGLPSCAPETLIVTQDKRFGDYREREEDGEDISGALNFGRLNVEKMVDDAFTRKGVERVAVLVCGPRALGRDVRRCVGDWVQEGKEVFWHEEKFGW